MKKWIEDSDLDYLPKQISEIMTSQYERGAFQFIKDFGVEVKIKFKRYGFHFDGDEKQRNIYTITLSRNRKTYKYLFGDSLIDTDRGFRPTPYDVLACLETAIPETFDEFCTDFEYSNDSIRAKQLYKAVKKEAEMVQDLFGDIIDELYEVANGEYPREKTNEVSMS